MAESEIKFFTGSKYIGQIDLEMNGQGKYIFPDGAATYVGAFKNGVFHGPGTITTNKYKIKGKFVDGHLNEIEDFRFPDNLEYKLENWEYCTPKDRRYAVEIRDGISPIGDGYETHVKPARTIPSGYYDMEHGFLNPINFSLFEPTKSGELKYVRNVSKCEKKWAAKNCRNTKSQPIGYNHDIITNDIATLKKHSRKWCCIKEPSPVPRCRRLIDHIIDTDSSLSISSEGDSKGERCSQCHCIHKYN